MYQSNSSIGRSEGDHAEAGKELTQTKLKR